MVTFCGGTTVFQQLSCIYNAFFRQTLLQGCFIECEILRSSYQSLLFIATAMNDTENLAAYHMFVYSEHTLFGTILVIYKDVIRTFNFLSLYLARPHSARPHSAIVTIIHYAIAST